MKEIANDAQEGRVDVLNKKEVVRHGLVILRSTLECYDSRIANCQCLQ